MENCIFCKIAHNKIPCYKIFEDKKFLVILDAFPSILGQILIIPKNHFVGSIFNLKKNLYQSIFLISKKIAKAMQEALNPIKVGMVIEGLEIEHVHIKLYPLNKRGLILKPMKERPSDEKMKEIVKKIISKLKN